MSQHFLLSSSAKSLGIMDIMSLTDDEALGLMCQSRWPETGGEPICPQCGSEASWKIRVRRQWRCKSCNHTYSVTSGTVFDNRKLPLKLYLLAILIFSNAAKSLSALQLSRDLKVHYRTAYRLAQLLRESLLATRDESPMTGHVEVDGGYTGTYIRPANRKEDRVDRRSAETPNKRCVLVMRQRGKHGADRTLTEIVRSESSDVVIDFVTGGTRAGTTVNADENAAYDSLAAWYDINRVNHSIEYRGEDGSNINQAESYFSRFRRMQWGQMHRLDVKYLALYANEIAWREDSRRMSNGKIFFEIMGKAFRLELPGTWRNYGYGRGLNSTTPALAEVA